MTVASILLGTDVRLMPLQLSQTSAWPFLKSFTSIPLLQSFGTFSLFQMATRRAVQTVMQARRDAFSISAVIPSTPGARPFFSFFTVVVTSSVLGGSALTSICKNGLSGTTSGSSGLGLFKTFSKCEAHLVSFLWIRDYVLISSFTRDVRFVFFPTISFVSRYTVFESPFLAASSASAAFSSITFLLSFLALLLTALSSSL